MIRTCVLFLALAGFASGAKLVCNEKEGSDEKVSCKLEVGYDDIASAWNLNCEPSEDGMKCYFEATKNNDGTVSIGMPNSVQIGVCDNGVCINSKVETQIAPDPEKSKTTPEAEKKQESQYEPVKQPETGILVGNYIYEEPYKQYAKPIETTLKAREELWRTPPKDIDIVTEYALANAHLDLGISHFTSVTEEDYSPGTHSDSAPESFDLKLAVNAFRVAEKMYKSILQKYDREKETVFASLAALYLQWGEVYQNSHYFDDDIVDDVAEFNKMALQQYQKSEKNYRLAMDSGKEKESLTTEAALKDIQLNLAHVSHRIGRCLINSIEGTAVMQEDLELSLDPQATTTESMENVLPQIKILLHTVPKAEEHFAEAIRLYRIAIEEESEDEAQIPTKMNLATTLQDAGTAASYASNLPKSIKLQEEGVSINKELLPHVGTADRQFLLQYIADSMYGLANHYMQLGRYEETKTTYKAAMDWYEEHHLDSATVAHGFEVTDESLEAYEKQLADYHELIREISMPDGYQDDGQPIYGPNHAYEADLRAALGSLHLSRDEILMAIDHFDQAINLYQKDESEEKLDRSIADVKVSLAAAYFKDGDYSTAVETHHEAMDMYKAEVGEGNNPMLAGLAEKLGGEVDLNDMLGASDLGDLLGSEGLQDLLTGLGAEDVTAALEKLVKKDEGSGPAGESDKTNENSEQKNVQNKNPDEGEQKNEHNDKFDEEAETKNKQKVHQELINAEIISMVTNATSMKGEL